MDGQGDAGNACVCLCSCLPFGDTAKLGKYGVKGAKKAIFRGSRKASENYAKSMAKQIQRDIGKSARREFHDLKKDGIDRTKDELIEDMEIIYEKYGKTPPKHF